MKHSRLGALCASVALLAAAAAVAQPELTVEIVAPQPTGSWTFVGTGDDPVAFNQSSGVAMTFAWSTPAWAAYRAGWDVTDPADPNDPGWVNPDYDPLFTSHTGPAFIQGVHSLTIAARDAVDAVTWARFLITYEEGVPTAVYRWGDLRGEFGGSEP